MADRPGVAPANGVGIVAYESSNSVANAGKNRWHRDSGLVSIWILVIRLQRAAGPLRDLEVLADLEALLEGERGEP